MQDRAESTYTVYLEENILANSALFCVFPSSFHCRKFHFYPSAGRRSQSLHQSIVMIIFTIHSQSLYHLLEPLLISSYFCVVMYALEYPPQQTGGVIILITTHAFKVALYYIIFISLLPSLMAWSCVHHLLTKVLSSVVCVYVIFIPTRCSFSFLCSCWELRLSHYDSCV